MVQIKMPNRLSSESQSKLSENVEVMGQKLAPQEKAKISKKKNFA